MTENSVGAGVVGSSGFEIARHDFRLTEEGKRIAQEKAKHNPDVWKRIKDAAAQFLQAGDVDYMKMSVAAKTFFILSDSGKPATSTFGVNSFSNNSGRVLHLIRSANALLLRP